MTVLYFKAIKIILLSLTFFPCQWYCCLICIVLWVSLLELRNVWVCKWCFVGIGTKPSAKVRLSISCSLLPIYGGPSSKQCAFLGGRCPPSSQTRLELTSTLTSVWEGAFMSDMPSDKTESAARCWALVPQSNLRKSVWLRGESLTLESGTERGLGSNPCSVAFCVTGEENVLSDPQLPHLKCRIHCPNGVVQCIKGHMEVVVLYKVQCKCQLSKKQGSLVVPRRATEYTCTLQWVVLYFHYHICCATHIPIAGKDLLHGISMESLKNAGYEVSVGQP